MSKKSRQVLLHLNLVRTDATLYLDTYYQSYRLARELQHYLPNSPTYVASLNRDAQKVKNLPLLKPSFWMTLNAKWHARYMGRKGKTGHSSPNRPSFSFWFKFLRADTMDENCSYGFNDPIAINFQLLIDDHTPSLGHRKAIFNKASNHVGISIKKHQKYDYNCVQDFYGKKKR